MQMSRRAFQRLVMGSSAYACLPAAIAAPLSGEPLPEFQPFAAQLSRLIVALEALGSPLSKAERSAIDAALRNTVPSDAETSIRSIMSVLDKHALLEVTLNPEVRVSAVRGMANPELVQHGWRTFLIKVWNNAAVSPVLKIKSPQGAPVGRRSSLAIEGVHDFTNGAVDEVEARARWIAVEIGRAHV